MMAADGPFFRIVMPGYNRAHLIAASIESVLAQTFNNYEIVIVDDGSTDDTPRVLAGYEDRVRIFYQANAGPGAARNRGVREARGRYLAFLDSDALYDPSAQRVFHDAIFQHHYPTMFLAKRVEFNGDAAPVQRQGDAVRTTAHVDFFSHYRDPADQWIGLAGTVMQREPVLAVGGFIDLPINAEDLDFIYRLGAHPGVVHVSEPILVAVRKHEGNVTRAMHKTVQGFRYLLEQRAHGRYRGGAGRRHERAVILSRGVRSLCMWLLAAGDRHGVGRLYRAGLSCLRRDGRWRFLVAVPFYLLLGRPPRPYRAVSPIR